MMKYFYPKSGENILRSGAARKYLIYLQKYFNEI